MNQRLAILAATSALLLAGCGTSSTSSSTHATKPKCIHNAPGTLCGSDAAAYCQNMKLGQQVDPAGVGAQTVRECARLGVKGLRP